MFHRCGSRDVVAGCWRGLVRCSSQSSTCLDLGSPIESLHPVVCQSCSRLGSAGRLMLRCRSTCWLLALVALALALHVACTRCQDRCILASCILNGIDRLLPAPLVAVYWNLLPRGRRSNELRSFPSRGEAVGYHPIIQVITCIIYSTHSVRVV